MIQSGHPSGAERTLTPAHHLLLNPRPAFFSAVLGRYDALALGEAV